MCGGLLLGWWFRVGGGACAMIGNLDSSLQVKSVLVKEGRWWLHDLKLFPIFGVVFFFPTPIGGDFPPTRWMDHYV